MLYILGTIKTAPKTVSLDVFHRDALPGALRLGNLGRPVALAADSSDGFYLLDREFSIDHRGVRHFNQVGD